MVHVGSVERRDCAQVRSSVSQFTSSSDRSLSVLAKRFYIVHELRLLECSADRLCVETDSVSGVSFVGLFDVAARLCAELEIDQYM